MQVRIIKMQAVPATDKKGKNVKSGDTAAAVAKLGAFLSAVLGSQAAPALPDSPLDGASCPLCGRGASSADAEPDLGGAGTHVVYLSGPQPAFLPASFCPQCLRLSPLDKTGNPISASEANRILGHTDDGEVADATDEPLDLKSTEIEKSGISTLKTFDDILDHAILQHTKPADHGKFYEGASYVHPNGGHVQVGNEDDFTCDVIDDANHRGVLHNYKLAYDLARERDSNWHIHEPILEAIYEGVREEAKRRGLPDNYFDQFHNLRPELQKRGLARMTSNSGHLGVQVDTPLTSSQLRTIRGQFDARGRRSFNFDIRSPNGIHSPMRATWEDFDNKLHDVGFHPNSSLSSGEVSKALTPPKPGLGGTVRLGGVAAKAAPYVQTDLKGATAHFIHPGGVVSISGPQHRTHDDWLNHTGANGAEVAQQAVKHEAPQINGRPSYASYHIEHDNPALWQAAQDHYNQVHAGQGYKTHVRFNINRGGHYETGTIDPNHENWRQAYLESPRSTVAQPVSAKPLSAGPSFAGLHKSFSSLEDAFASDGRLQRALRRSGRLSKALTPPKPGLGGTVRLGGVPARLAPYHQTDLQGATSHFIHPGGVLSLNQPQHRTHDEWLNHTQADGAQLARDAVKHESPQYQGRPAYASYHIEHDNPALWRAAQDHYAQTHHAHGYKTYVRYSIPDGAGQYRTGSIDASHPDWRQAYLESQHQSSPTPAAQPRPVTPPASYLRKSTAKEEKPHGNYRFPTRQEIPPEAWRNPKAYGLRWVTVHPHGNFAGFPLLVFDDGDDYVVVGGGGGHFDGTKFKKPEAKTSQERQERVRARKEARESAKNMLAHGPEWLREHHEKQKVIGEHIKQAQSGLRDKVLSFLGIQGPGGETNLGEHNKEGQASGQAPLSGIGGPANIIDDLISRVSAQAESEAEKHLSGSDEETKQQAKQEFVERAKQSALTELHGEVAKVIARALDLAALRELGDEDTSLKDVEIAVGDNKIVRTLSDAEIDSIVRQRATIAALKAERNAVRAALNRGIKAASQGLDTEDGEPNGDIQTRLKEIESGLSEAEVKKLTVDGYLNRQRVKSNVALLLAARGREVLPAVDEQSGIALSAPSCSPVAHRKHLAAGALDALNSLCHDKTGSCPLTPHLIRVLGVEDSARVAAHYLAAHDVDIQQEAGNIRARIADHALNTTQAVLNQIAEAQRQGDLAMQAAEKVQRDDGAFEEPLLTRMQAWAIQSRVAQEQYKLAGTAEGEMRACAALAHELEKIEKAGKNRDEDFEQKHFSVQISGGDSLVAAKRVAHNLGLQDGEYEVQSKNGETGVYGDGGHGTSYTLKVPLVTLAMLGTDLPQKASDRDQLFAEIADQVHEEPGKYHPAGLKDDVRLFPHQEIGARCLVEGKHVCWNYSAGSGKTPTLMASLADLISSNSIDRALIVMPSKPRAQQEDYIDPDTGQGRIGEKNKFLKPEVASQVVVVKDGIDLKKQIERVNKGEIKALIVSPELIGKYGDELEKAGFGGKRSFVFLDEAHLFASGEGKGKTQVKDEAKAQRARAAEKLCRAEWSCVASGTLVQTSGQDLHSVYSLVFPGELGSRAEFSKMWERAARGSNNLTSSEMRGLLKRKLGGMISYSKPVTDRFTGEYLQLHHNEVTVPLAPEQKEALAKARDDYKRDKKSDDPQVRAAAALTYHARAKEICEAGVLSKGRTINPKLEALSKLVEAERRDDPQAKVGVYSFQLAPLRRAKQHLEGSLGDHMVSVTGEDDDEVVRKAVKAVNDPDSGIGGVAISSAGDTGLNLQGLKHIYKLGVIGNQGREKQLDHRHYREGAQEDKYVTSILTDSPFEQKLQYISRHVRQPQVALLAQIADDSGLAENLAVNWTSVGEPLSKIESVNNSVIMKSNTGNSKNSSPTVPYNDLSHDKARKFVIDKWRERAASMGRNDPSDLSNACKFSSMFAQKIFGGELRGNYNHQFVLHPKHGIIDLTNGDGIRHLGEQAYKHDKKFWNNKEHRESMESCEPRVNSWVSEFLGNKDNHS